MIAKPLAPAAVACLLLIQPATSGGVDAARQHLNPSIAKARLLKAESHYAVWCASTLHPETAGHRAPLFTHRFYRQRLGEQNGALIYQLVDTSVPFLVAVRGDGSVLLETSRQLHYTPSAGHATSQPIGWLHCLAVYPDGLLGADTSNKYITQGYPVFFVPFDGLRLRMDDRIQVVEGGVKRFMHEGGLGYPAEPYRFGNALAWVSDSTLHTFDLSSRRRTAVKLVSDMHPSTPVSAFDGRTVVCGIYAFDAANGELLGEQEYSKRPKNVISVFAVRNRIGYYYDLANRSLRATDLTAKDAASIEILDAEPVVPHQSDEGLTVWNGKRWTLVPWLKELRRP